MPSFPQDKLQKMVPAQPLGDTLLGIAWIHAGFVTCDLQITTIILKTEFSDVIIIYFKFMKLRVVYIATK